MANREQQMLDLVEAIHQHEARLMEIQRKLESVQDHILSIRNRLWIDVSLETDERGRRIYTNRDLRRAEVALRMDGNAGARALRDRQSRLRQEHSRVAAEKNYLRDKLEVLRLFAASK